MLTDLFRSSRHTTKKWSTWNSISLITSTSWIGRCPWPFFSSVHCYHIDQIYKNSLNPSTNKFTCWSHTLLSQNIYKFKMHNAEYKMQPINNWEFKGYNTWWAGSSSFWVNKGEIFRNSTYSFHYNLQELEQAQRNHIWIYITLICYHSIPIVRFPFN